MSLLSMKMIFRKFSSVCARAGFALVLTCAPRPLVSYAVAQSDPAPGTIQKPESAAIPDDAGELALYGHPRDYDEPGVIAYGGYCTEGARLSKASYRDADDFAREALVEVVLHPGGYNYVKHDFFGTFWVVLNDPMARTGAKDAPPAVFAFREVAASGNSSPQYVCIAMFPKEDRRREGTFEGVVGWYEGSGNTITTVMIRFEGLKGIPISLMQRYLAEHPSDVQNDDPRFANWVAHDIAKWTALLQTRAGEDMILQAAANQLRHYDRGAFGLAELWAKRKDSAALSDGVDAAVARMDDWLQERQRSQSQSPSP